MTKSLFFLPLLFSMYYSSLSQESKYFDQCKLIQDFLDYSDQNNFNFEKMKLDSMITVYDVDGVLSKCSISTVGHLKLNIVNSGSEVEKIKKGGIFQSTTRLRSNFVLQKIRRDGLTSFSLYHPYSNGAGSWSFEKRQNRYYFRKKSFGWF